LRPSIFRPNLLYSLDMEDKPVATSRLLDKAIISNSSVTGYQISGLDYKITNNGNETLIIEDCDITNTSIDGNLSAIGFKRCNIIGRLNVSSTKVPIMVFEGCHGTAEIVIKSNLKTVSVTDCKGFAFFTIEQSTARTIQRAHLTISKSDILDVMIHYQSFEKIEISNINVEKLTIWTNETGMVNINTANSKIEPISNIKQLNIAGGIHQLNSSFVNYNRAAIFPKRPISISMEGVFFKEAFQIRTSGQINYIRMKGRKGFSKPSGLFQISGDPDKKANVLQLHFVDYNVSKFELVDVPNVGTLSLNEVRITDTLDISGVAIESVSFNAVKLKNAVLKVHNIKASSLEFKGVEWPTNNRAYEFGGRKQHLSASDYIFNLTAIRESYRRLKVHFLEQHNNFDAMLFATNELRVEERIKRTEMLTSLRSFQRYIGDWFVLFTNRVFSNFGISWLRPLWIWLLIHFFLFHFILLNFDLGVTPILNIQSIEHTPFDWDATSYGFNTYLKLLFPVHDSEVKMFNCDTKKADVWGTLDFTMRLVSSYFIFLVIRGTRKYNFNLK
jgi:hypothetical protein